MADFIIIITSGINVLVHIFIKELHNIMGAIVIALCASVNISYAFQLTTTVFQYLYPVHGSAWVCATLKYGVASFLFMHEVLKVTYFCLFGYLMYRSYKLKPTGPNNTLLCCIYIITTIVVTTISMAIVVAKGLTGPRNTCILATTSEVYCNKFFHCFAPLLLSLLATLQVIAFISTLRLYLLSTKSCHGKHLSDARVAIVISTIGLNIVILITLLLVGAAGVSSVIAANSTACVEQIALLIICLTCKKVKKRLNKIFFKFKTESFTA